MSGGLREEWKLRELDQPLSAPTDIYTTPDSNYLYVADSGNRRVVILAKESGLYNRQFICTGNNGIWSNMKDLWADEENSTIYVLEGSKVYKVGY